ncbi:MAG TPA: phosphatidate cytidylyltransferase [Gammaproteobacteria bacterium]|nr:phosphatidate cytidylyltransferase [Gammaproteobacteria bacterium]
MLKQRVITALALLPLVVLLVLLATTWLLALVAGLMALAGSWEWAILSGEKTTLLKISNTVLVAVLLYLLWLSRQDVLILWIVTLTALVWWLFAILWVFWWRRQFHSRVKYFCGMLTLIPAWATLVALHASQNGAVKLLFLLTLIWAADIGAYFAGRVFGKHKLVPEVSPGKTWEGVVGGTLALLVVSLVGVWLVLPAYGYLLILICLLTGWLSIVGDLSESLFKRQAGVKDSGMLFPGHGGVLDRVDSLTAALPAFWVGLALQEWLR